MAAIHLKSVYFALFTISVLGQRQHFQSIDVFPSPQSTGAGGWEAAVSEAESFIKSLSLLERANLVTGTDGPCGGNIGPITRVGFKGLCMQDSPLGVREVDFNTVFPAGLSAAATFDKDMIYRRGLYMGAEFHGKGINVALSPSAGPMGRQALGGRNWEGFGIDPYLAGIAFGATVHGFVENRVQTCGKHFIANEQETWRLPSRGPGPVIHSLSSNIDDRTMHELYLWPFADAVKAGLTHIMCSYNRLNQTYACENSKLLNGLLKDELGFQGSVVSDWGATRSGLFAANSGLDVTMPGGTRSPFGTNLVTLVNNGSLPESRLNDMAKRLLAPYFLFAQHEEDYPQVDPSTVDIKTTKLNASQLAGFNLGGPKSRDVRSDHGKFVREMGSASAVLLKNTGVLPLKNPKNIGVFGYDAADQSEGLFEATFLKDSIGPDYGGMGQGGGSGSARYSYFVSPLEAIKTRAKKDNALVQYILSNEQAAESIHTIYPTPEVCLVFLKTFAAEGFDRVSLDVDWNGTTVVQTVARSCPNTVVITHSAGINIMPWADNPNVTAIIAGHLPGQEMGNSIVDVLYGDYNPTGKLPYTIAFDQADYNAPILNLTNVTNPNAWQDDFTEGLLVDYRYFDAENITPRFEFGFGLSYTDFTVDSVGITGIKTPIHAFPPTINETAPGGHPALYEHEIHIRADVSNTGSLPGETVVQLYVKFPASAPEGTPVKVLRGFEKTKNLEPGQNEALEFKLKRRDVSYWDVVAQEWRIPAGEFTFLVGLSSRDIRHEVKASLVKVKP